MSRRLPKVRTLTDVVSIGFICGSVGFPVVALPAHVLALFGWAASEGHGVNRSTPAFWIGGTVGVMLFATAGITWAILDRRRC
jgi:hypothetical protein